MTTYRTTDMGKVRVCYESLAPEERSGMIGDSLTMAQASSIERKLQGHGLSLTVHYEELKLCVFDEKTDETNEKTESRLEERIEPERKKQGESKNKSGIFFTKQGDVDGDVDVVAGLSIAQSVGGSQYAGFGAINCAQSVGGSQVALLGAINCAQSVGGDQYAVFGAAINCAQSVGGDQGALLGAAFNCAQSVGGSQYAVIGAAINCAQSVGGDQWAGLGAAINCAQSVGGDQGALFGAINYAGEVMGNQFAYTGCAVNVAKRVGKNQGGLLNIVTEIIQGKQMGLFNYAKKLGKNAKQFGLVNLEAKHSDKTRKRSTSGPQKWWNPEISFFYRKGGEEKSGSADTLEQDASIEDIASKAQYAAPVLARVELDEEEQEIEKVRTRTVRGRRAEQ